MKKKVGNAVKRNRIKRKLKGVVQKMLKSNNSINLNYIYIILGKEKVYNEHSNSLFENMEISFTVLPGRKSTVLQYYLLFTIQF